MSGASYQNLCVFCDTNFYSPVPIKYSRLIFFCNIFSPYFQDNFGLGFKVLDDNKGVGGVIYASRFPLLNRKIGNAHYQLRELF